MVEAFNCSTLTIKLIVIALKSFTEISKSLSLELLLHSVLPGNDPIKILQRKFYAIFSSILIG